MEATYFQVQGRPQAARGVTLLELLVVMALASLLLALVFPAVGAGLGTLELRTSAQRLAAAAKFARDQAVYQHRLFQLVIDRDAGTVSVMDGEGNSRRSFAIPAGVRFEEILPADERTQSGLRRFVFFPDGGSVAFEIILGNQRRRIRVSSDPLTGFAKVSEL